MVAEGLTRRFEDVTAVEDVSFQVPTATILGIIGPSGSGKTTTLRMLMGSLAPTEGHVRVLGDEPLQFRRATRERIGYLPQAFVLYPDLTTKENVDFVGSLYGLLLFRRARRTREVLQLVDLWDVRGRKAGELSGGMQRRLELACALVHQPRLLILDEPTAGVDPLLRRAIWEELHRLRDGGTTILVTTQYVTEAEECDEVALISEGRLVAFATPAELRRAAYGGDVVDVTTDDTFDATVLQSMPRVRAVRQMGLRDFRVIVDDGAAATPELVDEIGRQGAEVAAAREARPSFEEVFAQLVERDRLDRDRLAVDAERATDARPDADDPDEPSPGPRARALRAGAPAPQEGAMPTLQDDLATEARARAVDVPPEEGPPPSEEEPPGRRPEDDWPPPQRMPGDADATQVQRAPGADEDLTQDGARGPR